VRKYSSARSGIQTAGGRDLCGFGREAEGAWLRGNQGGHFEQARKGDDERAFFSGEPSGDRTRERKVGGNLGTRVHFTWLAQARQGDGRSDQ
jgi:hypothetical protein